MKNQTFYKLLHGVKDESGKRPRWSVEKIAEAIYCRRERVNDALNNRTGGPGENHGKQIRPKLVKFFKAQFPEVWPELLAALGWDQNGSLRTATGKGVDVSRGTLHVEQNGTLDAKQCETK